MDLMSDKSYRRNMIVLLIITTFSCLAFTLGEFSATKVTHMQDTNIKIIEKPVFYETAIPEPENLEIIEGIPEDIEEDYDIKVSNQVNEDIYEQPFIKDTVINILIVGTDVRDNDQSFGRSDCMLLLTYNRKTKEAVLTSFLRDIWISIPNYGWNRLNAAYAFGGAGLLINTINENFGLDIQHYVLVDFNGLKTIVDDLGGIEVFLTKKEAQHINKRCRLDSEKLSEEDGTQLLNGAQTLSHSRNRKSPRGDFDRTQRQRDVMLSLFKRMKSENTLPKLTSVLSTAIKNVKTNISLGLMVDLGLEVILAESLDLQQVRVPFDGTWNYANKDGRSVIVIDLQATQKSLKTILYDGVTAPK